MLPVPRPNRCLIASVVVIGLALFEIAVAEVKLTLRNGRRRDIHELEVGHHSYCNFCSI